MRDKSKILKSGISKAIICSRCGKQVGTIRLKTKMKWRTVRWAIGLGLLFEIVANIVVAIIFNYGK